jgi:hypothetical protein
VLVEYLPVGGWYTPRVGFLLESPFWWWLFSMLDTDSERFEAIGFL